MRDEQIKEFIKQIELKPQVTQIEGTIQLPNTHVLLNIEVVKDLLDTIEALQQENEQILSALKQAREVLKLSKTHIESCFVTVHNKIDGCIKAIDKAIGGKEVECDA